MNLHDFYIGKSFDAYKYFGANFEENKVVFRVYAPNAKNVCIIGDFNNWTEENMIKDGTGGIFYFYSEKAKEGMMYKYRIYKSDGTVLDHADPYAKGAELRPNNASIIRDINNFKFTDDKWLCKRDKNYNLPMNIYEVHLGSWKTNNKNENGWFTYREIAQPLIEYVKSHNYTHIEIMPISEYPADCSWGYQVSGFFSPTSRYGTCSDLQYLINECHNENIGVILDFVPVHFVINEDILANFDGTALYEYPNTDTGISEWGSKNFNYYRGEVCSFLQSAASYWIGEYHFDGLRMDAISNIIYWQGNSNRGVNQGAVNFIKNMNIGLHQMYPNVILIAEDSTDFLKVTAPVEYDGLGFDYKWDMGWMNDTLEYFKIHPNDRPIHYHKITFSMQYFYNELFLLPFSHDEVVHGKATIMQKMWGDYDVKFPQCRALYAYMYTHPGKKLNFMGNEIGQFREWDEKREQDWDILKYPLHNSFQHYIDDLTNIYISSPALYDGDYNSISFKWLVCNQPETSIYIYERICSTQTLIIALNFSDNNYKNFTFNVENEIKLKEILNSNYDVYGGNIPTPNKELIIISEPDEKNKNTFSVKIDLSPFSAKIFEIC